MSTLRTTDGRPISGVVVLSAVDWTHLQQRPHHLTRTWAEELNLACIFVENTGARALRWTDAGRIRRRLRRALKPEERAADLPPGIEVISPLVLPGTGQAVAALNGWWLGSRMRRSFRQRSLRPEELALVICLPTPLMAAILGAFPWGLRVYDVVADVTADKRHLGVPEDRILVQADAITSASHTLKVKYEQRSGRPVRYVPDGSVPVVLPERKTTSGRARLLYLGGVDSRIDVELLCDVARARPDWDLVLFGNVAASAKDLACLANVQIKGPVSRYDDLWPVLATASVGLVPYIRSAYTDGMHPAKLQEYLLAGLPVVATDTPEMTWMARTSEPGVIYVAGDARTFILAVERALVEDNTVLSGRRRVLATSRSWRTAAREFLNLEESPLP